ncbi:protein kinase domain-containing protein [Calothrix sp. 336/3]|uniref:protein kinase domain-containing protein n=1 Tax=Calothrix sp. 336/3 TaxID=1337936 RepID=UPI00069A0C5B|nr:protein kinase [Calothrix sp. 336/3]
MVLRKGDELRNPSGASYRVRTDFSSKDAGTSQWGFVEGEGAEYFAKRYLSPVNPGIKALGSEDVKRQRRSACAVFEERQQRLNNTLRDCSAAVTFVDFFAFGDESNRHYYKICPKIAPIATVEQIHAASAFAKLHVMQAAATALTMFHDCGLIHLDIKPQNILIHGTNLERPQAYLIDFDNSIFCLEDIKGAELVGDMSYYSPEVAERIVTNTLASTLTQKADIFSLGVVFFEYCTGHPVLATYGKEFYQWATENCKKRWILEDIDLWGRNSASTYQREVNGMFTSLISNMLSFDVSARTSLKEVLAILKKIIALIESEHMGYKLQEAYRDNRILEEDNQKLNEEIEELILIENQYESLQLKYKEQQKFLEKYKKLYSNNEELKKAQEKNIVKLRENLNDDDKYINFLEEKLHFYTNLSVILSVWVVPSVLWAFSTLPFFPLSFGFKVQREVIEERRPLGESVLGEPTEPPLLPADVPPPEKSR